MSVNGIAYSDGASHESRVLEILRAARELGSGVQVAPAGEMSWPVRYHLTPERANLARPFDWEGLDVLEIGAGMGAVSRHLAERARSLEIVEGTAPRYECLKERLRDLGNWKGRVGNFQDQSFDRTYDVVCLFGVLEYSGLYVKTPKGYAKTPFHWMLERARSLAGRDGVVVLAIENALGLKYWNGAGEDHTGALYDGICGYPLGGSPKTFSRKALLALLAESGLPIVDEYYPFPDYKLASSVVSRELVERDPGLAGELAGIRRSEDYTGRWRPLFPESLAWQNVADAGLVGELAPSFLFVASPRAEAAARWRLQAARLERWEEGWLYSSPLRRIPTRTTFFADGQVRKRAIGKVSGALPGFEWKSPADAPRVQGQWVQQLLTRAAYYGEWERYREEWDRFLAWSLRRWAASNGSAGNLQGEALDAVIVNARREPSGDGYRLFDLEWRSSSAVPRSWFVFRNVYMIERDLDVYSADAPFQSLSTLYGQLCRGHGVQPDLAGDIRREAEFQSAAVDIDRVGAEMHLTRLFDRPFPPSRLARNPARERARLDREEIARVALAQVKRRVPWLKSGYRAVKGLFRT